MNVIVHGVQTVSEDWAEVARLIGPSVVPDRRGRKGVELPGDFGLRTEIDDLHRVLDRHERPVLIGHSYGGLIAMLTAQERDDLAAVILYEPAIELETGVLDRVGEALRGGDRDAALALVVTEVAGEEPFRSANARNACSAAVRGPSGKTRKARSSRCRARTTSRTSATLSCWPRSSGQ